jgi:hypothetical protein
LEEIVAKKIIGSIVAGFAFSIVAQVAVVLTKSNCLDGVDTTILLLIPTLNILLLVTGGYLIQIISPFIGEGKQYWKQMPQEDREDLKRILGQAVRVLLRKPSRADTVSGKALRWILKFAE